MTDTRTTQEFLADWKFDDAMRFFKQKQEQANMLKKVQHASNAAVKEITKKL